MEKIKGFTMNYYQDITLLPDAEANLGFLWHKVYQQIHLALVENKVAEHSSAIGLSIPEYNSKADAKAFPLGQKIRLFAKEQAQLERLNLNSWLKRFLDYAHITSIKAVPDKVDKFVCFSRKQVKGKARIEKDITRSAQHQSTKFNLPYEECVNTLRKRPKASFQEEKLPFITVTSLSSGEGDNGAKNKFRLFIVMKKATKESTGTFNCYGLSSQSVEENASVPWF
ncbi:type I-F CRISPR-associated endoribonuclease Cas6/Csy4 [Agarilytica rhodophyticola]|uniref:type I-F CRISPR-associated endoribonuclease Cas6/Csy4 n=1 Tax=Agarilytica rhodophyticola TaxID=1737490 RepID=UPI001C1F270B|nr:type I-F CRISPR-associated endoribonuclease Cas6/Csy4 [Agarilytica rhodophyticola]